MGSRLVLGLDFGTTTAKAVLAEEHGRVLATAAVAQRVERGPNGEAEQDPEAWWADLGSLVAETWGRAVTGQGTDALELAGIGISGHLPTLVLVDSGGRLLGPALLYADRRADGSIARARELFGEDLRGDEVLPKLLWLADHEAGGLRRVGRVHTLVDYLTHRLTGVRALDHRTAMRTALFDPVVLGWREDLLAAVGLDPGVLPVPTGGGDVAGRALPGPAAELGTPAGTPVLVGLGDTPATMVGAGAVRVGDAMIYHGTTTTVDVCTHDFEAYLRDPAPIRDWAPYRLVSYAVLGPAMAWLARGLVPDDGGEAQPDLAGLDAQAAALPMDVDAPFVLPRFDAHAAEPGHAPSAIIGLQPAHDRAVLHRAMLESFAFVARAGLEDSGLASRTRRFVAAGGGARSAYWRQLVSDTLGAPQQWAPRADASLGMAMLAARATLGVDPLGAQLSEWLGEGEVTSPDGERQALQERRYARWREYRAALAAG